MFDISLTNRTNRLCSGTSRRDFLRVGALTAFGLSMPGLLQRQAMAANQEAAATGAARAARAKSVILIYLGGGISHHDTFDPKPSAPEEVRGKYKAIATNVAGVQVSELLPKAAKIMDKICLVRSQMHGNDHHETATNWVLSGRFGSAQGDYPAMGAVVAHESGFTGLLPPYVAVPKNPSFTWELGKSAYLGGRYESFKAGDPNQPGYRVADLTLPAGTPARSLERRKSLLAAIDTLAHEVQGNDQMATYDEFQRRAADMVLSPEAQAAFDMGRESDSVRDDYGRNDFGQACLLARRLVERGVKFITINSGGWDHHKEIWKGLENKVPHLDQGFAALINDMSASGLLKETLVLVMGEFGRTPKVNKDAGRDHWGKAGSIIFAGAGIQGGRVVGATDKDGAFVTDRPVSPADVCYTVYDSLGIDPRKQLFTPEGRPVEILDQGSLIRELYS